MALHFRYETHFTFLTADGHALKDQVTALGLDINELPQVRRRSHQSCRATSPSQRSCWIFFLGNCGAKNPGEIRNRWLGRSQSMK